MPFTKLSAAATNVSMILDVSESTFIDDTETLSSTIVGILVWRAALLHGSEFWEGVLRLTFFSGVPNNFPLAFSGSSDWIVSWCVGLGYQVGFGAGCTLPWTHIGWWLTREKRKAWSSEFTAIIQLGYIFLMNWFNLYLTMQVSLRTNSYLQWLSTKRQKI